MCWMCEPNQYKCVKYDDRTVKRLVYEDEYTFVVVPLESHVKHHILVVLCEHTSGLIDCSPDDLAHLGSTISAACKILKSMGYDRVYAGCYSDCGHVHFHLIPFNHAVHKGFSGHAMQWLAELERHSDAHLFSGMTNKQKTERLDEIEIIFQQIKKAWSNN